MTAARMTVIATMRMTPMTGETARDSVKILLICIVVSPRCAGREATVEKNTNRSSNACVLT
ncbi:hypothetical protein C456_14083 [Haloferax volcanii DSM 14919]|uniref:Uncharacterized protein n=1 Tax=Haloferax lucentense (strain DSM 14919 / JCM 9276 / NCIMB 13854 / Aa 2.2) TaxID=1230452 RepID=M0GLZ7_HALL2|nr:hypothetical protein C456_14083 [Haloferax lucentense DSM 14919]